jgi:hypothetical protein
MEVRALTTSTRLITAGAGLAALMVVLVGTASAARAAGPGCNAYIRGEDYNSTVDIGGCRMSVKELDITFPQPVTVSKTYTLNGYGSSRTGKAGQRNATTVAYKFATPLAPGSTGIIAHHGASYSSWFAITIQPALAAGEHVKITAVGTDGTKQNFVTVVHADPN